MFRIPVAAFLLFQDSPPPGQPAAPSPFGMLPLLLGLVAIFYLLVFRPERKRQKARTTLLASLRKNDRVVTTSGIHGVVAAVRDSEVVLRVDDDVRIRFNRDAVAAIVGRGEGEGADGKT